MTWAISGGMVPPPCVGGGSGNVWSVPLIVVPITRVGSRGKGW